MSYFKKKWFKEGWQQPGWFQAASVEDCPVAEATPEVPTVEGVPSPARTQSLSIAQNQIVKINWVFRQSGGRLGGNPIDLSSRTDCIFKVSFVEALSFPGTDSPIVLDATIEDATSGLVSVTTEADTFQAPGVYLAEWAFLNSDGGILLNHVGKLIVERSQFAAASSRLYGPPTIAEIRSLLRDNGAEDNFLLDETEWDPGEIAACIIRPVERWNTTGPRLRSYTTTNFPFRSNWLTGIMAGMYHLAASHYLRNSATYQGSGVSLNDKAKYREYEERAQRMWQEFDVWMKFEKASMNMESAFGSVNSDCNC